MKRKLDNKLLDQLKEKLEKEKKDLVEQLKTFATEDKKVKGDWDTRFPHRDGETGGGALEKEADEVEEYSTLLPIEHSLEKRLKDVNLALEEIKKSNYGICENCKEPISIKRLKVFPSARTCLQCKEVK